MSVVVPTTLRDTLKPALVSVRQQQTSAEIDIVLVVDGPRCPLPADIGPLADRVIWTGGAGAAAARNQGIQASDGEIIAFLDDDDEWLPGKVANQLALVVGDSGPFVLSCRVRQGQRTGSRTLSRPIPTRLWSLSEGPIEHYLFVRRPPSLDRASIYTSTLMVSADLARRVPWQTGLRRHQDWDWVMRLTREEGTRFAFSAEPDVTIWTNSAGSISACQDWASSLAWIGQWSNEVTPRVVADFIAAQPLRYALQAKSVRGLINCLAEIAQTRTCPSMGPLAIGVAGLAPRRLLLELLVAMPRLGKRGGSAGMPATPRPGG